jgi:hypothetical protein
MDNARTEQAMADTTADTRVNQAAATRALRRASILAGLTVGAYVVVASTTGGDPTPTLATLGG